MVSAVLARRPPWCWTSLNQLCIGMTVTFFFQVTDTGQESILYVAFNSDRSYSFLVYRVVVGDRTIDHFLLYHFFVARVVCGDLRIGGEFDG